MQTVNIHQAKTRLSAMLAQVQKGESFVIAKAGKPVARLVPLEPAKPRKLEDMLGFLKGQGTVPDDFNTMFQKEIEEMFYGSD